MSAGRGPTTFQAHNYWIFDVLGRWSRGGIFSEQDVADVCQMYYDVTVHTPHAFGLIFRLVELTLSHDRRLILDLSKRSHFLVFQNILLRQQRVVAQDKTMLIFLIVLDCKMLFAWNNGNHKSMKMVRRVNVMLTKSGLDPKDPAIEIRL